MHIIQHNAGQPPAIKSAHAAPEFRDGIKEAEAIGTAWLRPETLALADSLAAMFRRVFP